MPTCRAPLRHARNVGGVSCKCLVRGWESDLCTWCMWYPECLSVLWTLAACIRAQAPWNATNLDAMESPACQLHGNAELVAIQCLVAEIRARVRSESETPTSRLWHLISQAPGQATITHKVPQGCPTGGVHVHAAACPFPPRLPSWVAQGRAWTMGHPAEPECPAAQNTLWRRWKKPVWPSKGRVGKPLIRATRRYPDHPNPTSGG